MFRFALEKYMDWTEVEKYNLPISQNNKQVSVWICMATGGVFVVRLFVSLGIIRDRFPL